MTTKAVCIGINKYRDSPLQGCVNDALDVYRFLTEDMKVPADNVRLLLDERATRQAISDRLFWLCADSASGDHLIFHMSGHGTMIRRWNGLYLNNAEACLVPVDYDWSNDGSFLSDHDLHTVMTDSGMPIGVDLTFIFDVCHSGGMIDSTFKSVDLANLTSLQKDKLVGHTMSLARYLSPPMDIAARHRNRSLQVRNFGASWLQPDYNEPHRVLAACQEDQTAADSTFGINGRPNGAFTWALLQSLRQGEARTWLQITEDALTLLRNEGFVQVPALRARTAAINSYPLHS